MGQVIETQLCAPIAAVSPQFTKMQRKKLLQILSGCFLIVIVSINCGSESSTNSNIKKYCGYEMPGNEVTDVRTRGQQYNYSDKDMEIHSEIAAFAQDIGGDSIVIEVFFFLSNEKELGIYLFGPKDFQLIEKMSCAIINGKYKERVPPKKYILYYETNKEPLLAGIKSEI
jgi:hypothetical protein